MSDNDELNNYEILRLIEKMYAESSTLKDAWDGEKDELSRIIGGISSALADSYKFIEPLGIGGSGVVLRVCDRQLNVDRALKFPRPSPGKQQLLSDLLTGETDKLVSL